MSAAGSLLPALPALNLSKVKQLDEPAAGGITHRTHRRANPKDQHARPSGKGLSPYATRQQPVNTHPSKPTQQSDSRPGAGGARRRAPGALVATGSHAMMMVQQQTNPYSVYTKALAPPSSLLLPAEGNSNADGSFTARLPHVTQGSHAAAIRGPLTARNGASGTAAAYHHQPNTLDKQHGAQHGRVVEGGAGQASHMQPLQQAPSMPQGGAGQRLVPTLSLPQATDTGQATNRLPIVQQQHNQQRVVINGVHPHTPSHQPATSVAAPSHETSLQGPGTVVTVARRSSSGTSDAGNTWESGAITPAQALRRYAEYLTSFEQSEILDYAQVFFVGRSGAPKIKGNPHSSKANSGYDDERGDYNIVPHDHLAYRYEVLSILGKGSFGQVVKVHDFKTNKLCAVKVIRNKKRFHHQALVELKVLQHLRACDTEDQHHVVHIQDHFVFRNHLCISFELLSVNLYELVKQNNFMGLSLGLIRRFAQQILITLRYLKSLHIIHCDLKPENILLRQSNRSVVKVIDFGSSCFINERVYTYIQSRFYRSPEVILGLPYGCEIDMWSFGAILAELYTGYPLFPGEDEAEQLQCIMEVLDRPGADLVQAASRRTLFFDSKGAPRLSVNSQGKTHHPGAKSLTSMLRGADPEFIDLLTSCLRWDPQSRITPDYALQHPWITGEPRSQQAMPLTPRSTQLPSSSHTAPALPAGSTIRSGAAVALPQQQHHQQPVLSSGPVQQHQYQQHASTGYAGTTAVDHTPRTHVALLQPSNIVTTATHLSAAPPVVLLPQTTNLQAVDQPNSSVPSACNSLLAPVVTMNAVISVQQPLPAEPLTGSSQPHVVKPLNWQGLQTGPGANLQGLQTGSGINVAPNTPRGGAVRFTSQAAAGAVLPPTFSVGLHPPTVNGAVSSMPSMPATMLGSPPAPSGAAAGVHTVGVLVSPVAAATVPIGLQHVQQGSVTTVVQGQQPQSSVTHRQSEVLHHTQQPQQGRAAGQLMSNGAVSTGVAVHGCSGMEVDSTGL